MSGYSKSSPSMWNSVLVAGGLLVALMVRFQSATMSGVASRTDRVGLI